ncbi:MAG: hypothetical protein U0T82_00625 [Bacteroidales bacterium]
MKREKRYILIILLLLTGYVTLEYFAPEPVDWRPSYSSEDKIPYGGFVARQQLKSAFRDQLIVENNVSFTESLPLFRRENRFSLFILTQEFNPDPWEINQLILAAKEGNVIFISAYELGQAFGDSMGIRMEINPFDSILFTRDSSRLILVNPALHKEGGYVMRHRLSPNYLTKTVSSEYIILGTDSRNRPNFISIPVGEGKIILHSQPVVFTNFNLLYDDADYTGALLSYLPEQLIVWDEYYKPGKGKSGSPLRFVLHQPALKAALYLLLGLLLLFLLTHSRRKQKLIPIIQPPRNSSLDYAHVLGQLYFNQGDHAGLALKKIHHFTEHCRRKYYLGAGIPDTAWMQRLAAKSAVPIEKFEQIYALADEIQLQKNIPVEKLIRLNALIEEFYQITR